VLQRAKSILETGPSQQASRRVPVHPLPFYNVPSLLLITDTSRSSSTSRTPCGEFDKTLALASEASNCDKGLGTWLTSRTSRPPMPHATVLLARPMMQRCLSALWATVTMVGSMLPTRATGIQSTLRLARLVWSVLPVVYLTSAASALHVRAQSR